MLIWHNIRSRTLLIAMLILTSVMTSTTHILSLIIGSIADAESKHKFVLYNLTTYPDHIKTALSTFSIFTAISIFVSLIHYYNTKPKLVEEVEVIEQVKESITDIK